MSKVIADAKKNAHPKGSITGPKGTLAQKSTGLTVPFGSLKSARSTRRPNILPPKP